MSVQATTLAPNTILYANELFELIYPRGAFYMRKQQNTASGNYSSWLNKPVLLHVATGGLLTVLNCVIVSESDATLQVRIGSLWDVDVFKEMIVAVQMGVCVGPRLAN